MPLWKNTRIVDANVILRYLLKDDALSVSALEIVESGAFDVPVEVLAEVVFVLQKVYAVPRSEIAGLLREFARETDAFLVNEAVMTKALDFYEKTSFDFVDCILAAYSDIEGARIHTFDKKLAKFIARLGKEPRADDMK